MFMKNIRALIIFLLINTLALPLVASSGGKISGRITNKTTGEALIGVNIIVVDKEWGAASDVDGYYNILNVSPGTYEIMISAIGYATTRMQNMMVFTDMTTVLDVALDPTVIKGEEVIVVAEQPLVKKDLTSSKSTVSQEELEIMPVETSSEVLSTQAGVTTDSDGALHVRGGRSSEVTYMVDGIPVSESIGTSVSTNIISEISLISGTFNAEYGKAMSGVVNITTKDPDREFVMNVKGQSGDMYSNHTDIFQYSNEYNPATFTRTDIDVSGPVPFLSKAGYFLTATMKNSEGWLYGTREHTTYDSYSMIGNNWNIMMTGDSARVAENPSYSLNTMAKLYYSLTDKSKLTYQLATGQGQWQSYSHSWKYNPDGRYHHENSRIFQALHYTASVTDKTYFTLNVSQSHRDAADYVHKINFPYKWNEDINGNGIIDQLGRNSDGSPFTEDLNGDGVLGIDNIDQDFIAQYGAFIPNPTAYTIGDSINVPYYVNPISRSDVPAYHFVYGGQEMGYYMSSNDQNTFKGDFTSQINRTNQIRTGFEYNRYTYSIDYMSIEMSNRTLWMPYISDISSSAHNRYTKHPEDFSAYIQDKIEVKDFIMNIGLRYDYFNANDYTFTDVNNPSGSDTLRASVKNQISPRLGLSFPITDQGFIHFSYGHFFQMPGFSYLYLNPTLKKTAGVSQFGNPDLDAQKTVMYELGFQQQFGTSTAIDVTMFYRDIINWLSSEYNFIDNVFRYTKYVTQDYGNVRGITLALTQRAGTGLTLNLDYTYQIAEGNSSSPDAAYYDNLQIPPIESEKRVVPLSWDVRHSINANITLRPTKNTGLSVLSSYASGSPYTPSIQGQRNADENSDNKPGIFNTDIQAYTNFRPFGQNLRLAVKVYNLFDRLNERVVHTDTGRSGYSLVPTYAGDDLAQHQGEPGVHSLDEILTPPTYYSNPRQILVSLSWQFKR